MSPRSTRGVPWWLFLLALVMAAAFAYLWQKSESREHERVQVTSTATDFLVALTNFKASTIQSDVNKIEGFAVGDFKHQVDHFFGKTSIAAIKKSKATSRGRIQSVFVESIDGDSAEVFGIVNETVTNAKAPDPRAAVLRIDVEMIQTKDSWKVNRVTLLESPGGPGLGG